MFRKNELTRRIMTLHCNLGDLLYVCKSVYDCGKKNHVEAPLFYSNYEAVQNAAIQNGRADSQAARLEEVHTDQ